mmetsp:Transcript_20735/g.65202  ORF Transcript_20735/g.65202 Transcript_20735/m.65202 type:complete len:201 (-) Transcript_20735:3339-3941(-)
MMETRSQRASTSSMRCEVRTTARASMVARRTFQRLRRETGSRPAEGSSRRTSPGSPTMETAVQSLRFMPPLRREASLSAWGRSSSWSRAASTSLVASLAGTPRSWAKSLRWSAQVRKSQRVLSWLTTPRTLEASSKSSRTEWVSTRTSPVVGATSRRIMLSVVDLPAPFAPRRPKTSPRATRKVTSWTATVSAASAALAG